MKHEDAGVELVCLCLVSVFLLFVLFFVGLSLFHFWNGSGDVYCICVE